ncbi:BREX-1 system adenine-specific DNA-methyltransferase PglX [Opitutales bacterium]|nr:BREX-1 system adenine-specific DNA-methyltransferase PglX [Opitutales bacterium]
MICFRLLDSDDPAEPLAQAVAKVCEGENPPDVYSVNPTSFRKVPNAPFAYWVSERIRNLFSELPQFEGDERTAKQGLASGDDFRFVRTTWETPSNYQIKSWFPFAKGGSYSPFYADVYLSVNWGKDGTELDTFTGSVIRNADFYFRPGLTWPRRTTSGMSMRIMPQNCVFADKGPAAFFDMGNSDAWAFLSLIQAQAFQALVALQLAAGDAAARSYEVGVIQRTVIPPLDEKSSANLSTFAHSAWSTKRSTDTANQTSHAFYAPALTPRRTKPLPTHSS